MDKINRLKKLRLERGISQEKCAEETGISLSSIKRYENGGIIGNAYNLKRLSEYFCVDMDYIYTQNEQIQRNEEEKKYGIKRNSIDPRNCSRNDEL